MHTYRVIEVIMLIVSKLCQFSSFYIPPTSDTVDVHNTFLSPQEYQWCNGCNNDAEVNSWMPIMSNNIRNMHDTFSILYYLYVYIYVLLTVCSSWL